MKIIICENYDEMSGKAAEIVAQSINGKKAVLGLATGSTPESMYARLSQMCESGKCDFSAVTTFNLDEYLNIAFNNEQSYHYFMYNKLFDNVNIKKANINIPDGNAPDIAKAAKRYDQKIESSGGIDLQVLGIGPNGHIGFNEPADELISDTHVTDLTDSTISANSRFFKSADEVPSQAITMGMRSIMQAKSILLLASGVQKYAPLHKLLDGIITTQCPVTFLNLHRDVTLVCDRAAYYGKE